MKIAALYRCFSRRIRTYMGNTVWETYHAVAAFVSFLFHAAAFTNIQTSSDGICVYVHDRKTFSLGSALAGKYDTERWTWKRTKQPIAQ